MNTVRTALFAGVLFFAPYTIASEGAATTVATSKPTMIDAIKTFMVARKEAVVSGVDTVGGYVTIPLQKLAALECLKGGRFEKSIPTVGRLIVSAAIVAGLYKLYALYNASQEDADDDIIFEEEEYEDNN